MQIHERSAITYNHNINILKQEVVRALKTILAISPGNAKLNIQRKYMENNGEDDLLDSETMNGNNEWLYVSLH